MGSSDEPTVYLSKRCNDATGYQTVPHHLI